MYMYVYVQYAHCVSINNTHFCFLLYLREK